jgi:DNA (cytosine-5)-methyltransferase 1
MSVKIKICSVFSGIGGLDLGFIANGNFLIRRAYDNSESAIQTYRDNIGHHIEKLDLRHHLPEKRDYDLVIGGPPCTQYSMGGKQLGLDPNHEGYLTLRFIEIIKHLQPKMFVFENVPGLVMGKMMPIFDHLLNEFKAAGYRTFPSPSTVGAPTIPITLDASNYGVPQARKRVFIIGCRNNCTKVNLIEPEPLNAIKQTLWNAIGHYPDPYDAESDRPSDHDERSLGRYQPGFNSRLQAYHRKWQAHRPSRTIHSHLISTEVHPSGTRRFTLREAATLQSFPESYRFQGSLAERFKNVANAVPPLLARAVAESVHDYYQNVWAITPQSKPLLCTP